MIIAIDSIKTSLFSKLYRKNITSICAVWLSVAPSRVNKSVKHCPASTSSFLLTQEACWCIVTKLLSQFSIGYPLNRKTKYNNNNSCLLTVWSTTKWPVSDTAQYTNTTNNWQIQHKRKIMVITTFTNYTQLRNSDHLREITWQHRDHFLFSSNWDVQQNLKTNKTTTLK
jgi:hypothetical protein